MNKNTGDGELDKILNLRCDACGEMNRDIGYNPEYKTGFWCGSCGHSNDIEIMYYSRRSPNQTSISQLTSDNPAIQNKLEGLQ